MYRTRWLFQLLCLSAILMLAACNASTPAPRTLTVLVGGRPAVLGGQQAARETLPCKLHV